MGGKRDRKTEESRTGKMGESRTGKKEESGTEKTWQEKTNLRYLLRDLKVEKILSAAQLLYQNNLFKNSIAQLLWENREK